MIVAATLLLLVAGPPAAWYAPAIYRIATNQGLLVIETDDDAVEVTVKQNGKLIKLVDRKTGREVTLKAGVYQLELSGDNRKQGLALETNQFTLVPRQPGNRPRPPGEADSPCGSGGDTSAVASHHGRHRTTWKESLTSREKYFGNREGYIVVGRLRLADRALADFKDKVASQLEILPDGQMVGPVANPARPIFFRAVGYETARLVVKDVVKDFDPNTQEPIDIGDVVLKRLPAADLPSISGQVTWELPHSQAKTTVLVTFYPEPLNTPGNGMTRPTSSVSVTVGLDGTFEAPEMSPGTFYLTVSAPGCANVHTPYQTVSGGERKDLGQFALERARVAKITWVQAPKPPFDTSRPRSRDLKADRLLGGAAEWRPIDRSSVRAVGKTASPRHD